MCGGKLEGEEEYTGLYKSVFREFMASYPAIYNCGDTPQTYSVCPLACLLNTPKSEGQ